MTRLALIVVLALLALAGRYALACWLAPFRNCRRCAGTGRAQPRAGIRRRPQPCRRCRATGKRLRIGRHVGNYLAATRRAARTAEHTTPTTTGTRR